MSISLEQIAEQQRLQKEVLIELVDNKLNATSGLFVQKGEMGGSTTYHGVVPIGWLAEKVGFAHMLPSFKAALEPDTNSVSITADTINEVLQRPLDWTRRPFLAAYLAGRKYHKFPSVTVVLTKPWADKPDAEYWDANGRAVSSAAVYEPMDKKGRCGFLEMGEDVLLFALDGQHRLLGAQGLMELVRTGRITMYHKDGRPTGKYTTLEDFSSAYGFDPADIYSRPNEQIGIEIISAVEKGEERVEARRRVRSVFVHTNKMAAPLTPGQLAQLDEDDGSAIVARIVATTHPFLKNQPGRKNRVNFENSTVARRSTVLTTLQTIKAMAESYLPAFEELRRWKKTGQLVPLRPDEDELDYGVEKMNELWTAMASLPSYQLLENGALTHQFRLFAEEGDGGRGHLLFRPVGQEALAAAAAQLHDKNYTIQDVFVPLARFDESGGFRMDDVSSFWWKAVYDNARGRVLVAGKDLASRIIVYLLGGLRDEPDKVENLREELARIRKVDDGDLVQDFDGSFVTADQFRLPEAII